MIDMTHRQMIHAVQLLFVIGAVLAVGISILFWNVLCDIRDLLQGPRG